MIQFACSETGNVNLGNDDVTLSVSDKVTGSLMLDLAIEKESLGLGKLILLATLKNRSAKEITFLPWGSPFEKSVTADFLTIIDLNIGVELQYQGLMVKRLPPEHSDYLIIAANRSIQNTIDISSSYTFCAQQRITLSFSNDLFSEKMLLIQVNANSIEIQLPDTFPAC